jgi:hypothetical protein
MTSVLKTGVWLRSLGVITFQGGRGTVDPLWKIYSSLSKVSPCKLTQLSDLQIFFLILKTYSSSSSSSRTSTPPWAHTYVSTSLNSDNGVSGAIQVQKLLESPSAHHQSWELELLNVVQWQFLENHLCTAGVVSIARVCWSQYTLPSPLLLACASKKWRDTIHELLHEMKWNVTDFSSRRREMKFMKYICVSWILLYLFHEISWDFMDKKGCRHGREASERMRKRVGPSLGCVSPRLVGLLTLEWGFGSSKTFVGHWFSLLFWPARVTQVPRDLIFRIHTNYKLAQAQRLESQRVCNKGFWNENHQAMKP